MEKASTRMGELRMNKWNEVCSRGGKKKAKQIKDAEREKSPSSTPSDHNPMPGNLRRQVISSSAENGKKNNK
jgi:hypothetical protein